jgi:hypothetical protein
VNSRIGDVYFDTCTLWNFAAVDRLDLLEQRYGHRARWTETVQWEVRRSASSTPCLRAVLAASWLGTPVEIGGDPAAGFFLTDDRPALDFARRRGVSGFDTRHIMEECFAYHEVGCPEAFDLLERMAAADRGVRVPASHLQVCPS